MAENEIDLTLNLAQQNSFSLRGLHKRIRSSGKIDQNARR
jgi:hypothetical protein